MMTHEIDVQSVLFLTIPLYILLYIFLFLEKMNKS